MSGMPSQNIKQHIIKMSDDIDSVKVLLGKLMEVCISLLVVWNMFDH
jgi:hypothetical protein